MAISTPITKDRLKNHFIYHAWKYLLVAVFGVFGWSLIYQTTAYRSPENMRVDVYVKSSSATSENILSYVDEIWKNVTPEVETVTGVELLNTGSDDYYSTMQLTTYIYAGEGDIYILPTEDFKSFASAGAFLPLEEYVQSGEIDVSGLDITSGYVAIADEDSGVYETKLYGIPLYELYGFMDGMNLDNRDCVLAVLVTNGNTENVIPFANAMLQKGRGDKPDWLIESENAEEDAQGESESPEDASDSEDDLQNDLSDSEGADTES